MRHYRGGARDLYARNTDLNRTVVLGVVVKVVQVTLDAEAREPSTGPGVVRCLMVFIVAAAAADVVVLLAIVVATFLLRPFGRRRGRRGRRVGDEAHAIRVGRLLVFVHKYALAGGRGHSDGPSSRLGRWYRAARRRRRLTIVVGWHVNGQHRQATENIRTGHVIVKTVVTTLPMS